MLVRCINNIDVGKLHLTIGKVYDVYYDSDPNYYHIMNDIGYEHRIKITLFEDISEVRDDKLKKLGI